MRVSSAALGARLLTHQTLTNRLSVYSRGIAVEEIQLGADDGNNADAQSVPAGLVYDLPHRSMDALWSNLFYPSSLKSKVMAHAAAAQMAANVGYDAEVIGCNRLVLLHGPPGTGQQDCNSENKRSPH